MGIVSWQDTYLPFTSPRTNQARLPPQLVSQAARTCSNQLDRTRQNCRLSLPQTLPQSPRLGLVHFWHLPVGGSRAGSCQGLDDIITILRFLLLFDLPNIYFSPYVCCRWMKEPWENNFLSVMGGGAENKLATYEFKILEFWRKNIAILLTIWLIVKNIPICDQPPWFDLMLQHF